MVGSAHLSNFSSSLPDAINDQYLVLNFAQLDTEATQLHLEVDTSQILNIALLVPTAYITSMVHAYGAVVCIVLDKRTVTECLCRTFG